MKTSRVLAASVLVLLLCGLVAPSLKVRSQRPLNTNQPASPPTRRSSPTPSPKPATTLSTVIAGSVVRILPPVVSAPYPLYVSNNPQECAKHVPSILFGGMICDAVLKAADMLPLMWKWEPCPASNCLKQIDGFHIYKVPKDTGYQGSNIIGSHALVSSQTNPAYTVKGIKPFSKTDCFVVRAYKGKSVSLDSPRFCADEVALGTATTIVGQESGSLFENKSSCGQDPFKVKFDPFEVRVGTQHFQASCTGEFDYEGVFFSTTKGTYKTTSSVRRP